MQIKIQFFSCNKLDLSDYALYEAEMKVTDMAKGVEQTAFTLEPVEVGGGAKHNHKLKPYQMRAPNAEEWKQVSLLLFFFLQRFFFKKKLYIFYEKKIVDDQN